jgi:hypothetical protein
MKYFRRIHGELILYAEMKKIKNKNKIENLKRLKIRKIKINLSIACKLLKYLNIFKEE